MTRTGEAIHSSIDQFKYCNLMKIVISTDKLNRGGKEKQLLLLAKGLLERGYDVFVLSKKDIDQDNYYKEIGFPREFIKTYGDSNRIRNKQRFVEIVSKFTPKLILNFDIHSSLWSNRYFKSTDETKVVNCTIRRGTPYNNIRSRLLSNICLRRSKYVIANSHAGLKLFHKQESRFQKVIYNGIDLSIYKNVRPIDLSQIFDQKEDNSSITKTLVSIGGLYKHKGHMTLIKALAMTDNKVCALIIGEGPERAKLQSKIDEQGISDRVKLIGRKHDVVSYLKSADIYVNPSWGEGCSNAILEAMASDLPVITTRDGGTPEITHEQSTLFFKKNDPHALARCIHDSFEDINIDTSGLDSWISQFCNDKMVEEYISFFNSITNSEE